MRKPYASATLGSARAATLNIPFLAQIAEGATGGRMRPHAAAAVPCSARLGYVWNCFGQTTRVVQSLAADVLLSR
jgi:hypothetical protein